MTAEADVRSALAEAQKMREGVASGEVEPGAVLDWRRRWFDRVRAHDEGEAFGDDPAEGEPGRRPGVTDSPSAVLHLDAWSHRLLHDILHECPEGPDPHEG